MGGAVKKEKYKVGRRLYKIKKRFPSITVRKFLFERVCRKVQNRPGRTKTLGKPRRYKSRAKGGDLYSEICGVAGRKNSLGGPISRGNLFHRIHKKVKVIFGARAIARGARRSLRGRPSRTLYRLKKPTRSLALVSQLPTEILRFFQI